MRETILLLLRIIRLIAVFCSFFVYYHNFVYICIEITESVSFNVIFLYFCFLRCNLSCKDLYGSCFINKAIKLLNLCNLLVEFLSVH